MILEKLINYYRILVPLVYLMAEETGLLGNSLDFWMPLNNLVLEIGKTLVNILKHVHQKVKLFYIKTSCYYLLLLLYIYNYILTN